MSSSLEHQASWESGVPGFLHRQFLEREKKAPASVNLGGQTVLVTGSNGGLGFEALRQLLQLGASRAIMAVRNKTKGDAAAAQLRKEFSGASIDVSILDMASYPSIQAFVKECAALDRLDVVILNAGGEIHQFQRDAETGHEGTFQLNYVSTILLSALLLPVLKAKKQPDRPSRLTVVGSDTAYWGEIDPVGPVMAQFDRGLENRYDAFVAYRNAKLTLIAGVMKLAAAVQAEDVIFNVANPGLCYGTYISQEGRGYLENLFRGVFIRAFGRSPQTGASAIVDSAVVQGAESHGSYMSDWTVKPYPPTLYTEQGKAMADRLWEETLEDLGAESISEALAQLR